MNWLKKLYLRRRSLALPVGIVLLVLILFNMVVTPLVMNSHEVVYRNVTIIDKVMRSENVPFMPSRALIYAEDANGSYHIFSNEAFLLRGKFAVMDVYFQLQEGETYDLTVVGYRIPPLNEFENIIHIESRNEGDLP